MKTLTQSINENTEISPKGYFHKYSKYITSKERENSLKAHDISNLKEGWFHDERTLKIEKIILDKNNHVKPDFLKYLQNNVKKIFPGFKNMKFEAGRHDGELIISYEVESPRGKYITKEPIILNYPDNINDMKSPFISYLDDYLDKNEK